MNIKLVVQPTRTTCLTSKKKNLNLPVEKYLDVQCDHVCDNIDERRTNIRLVFDSTFRHVVRLSMVNNPEEIKTKENQTNFNVENNEHKEISTPLLDIVLEFHSNCFFEVHLNETIERSGFFN